VTRGHPLSRDDARVQAPVPRYEIRVRGRVSEAALSAFEGMDADMAPAETVLHGPVSDQAGLHGLLDRIQSLGLELIEVRRLPSDDKGAS
jgi:hypothetical protein